MQPNLWDSRSGAGARVTQRDQARTRGVMVEPSWWADQDAAQERRALIEAFRVKYLEAAQARLMRLVPQPTTTTVPLDRLESITVGRLLAASGTSDVVAAHVVVCVRRARLPVVTSDPDDLRRLDPAVRLIVV